MKHLVYSVEDDKNIQFVIKAALENSGFEIKIFGEAEPFYKTLEQKLPDLILLDIMLPGEDGIAILQKLKSVPAWKEIPVIIVSAKSTEIDKVVGLDLGADDYLIKPFGVLELISRIKALLRRSGEDGREQILELNGLALSNAERICKYKGKETTLTAKEYELLKLLMAHNQKAVNREEIIGKVWGYDFLGESRTVDVHIKTIRQKLSSIGLNAEAIRTVRGIGYKMML